jgi:hypothetical protein
MNLIPPTNEIGVNYGFFCSFRRTEKGRTRAPYLDNGVNTQQIDGENLRKHRASALNSTW